MDLMFKRYSNPFSFIDSMLDYGSFSYSIDEVVKKNDDETMWQFYLHKIFNKSFQEFLQDTPVENKPITKAEFDATIEMSQSILDGMGPPEEDGDLC